MNNRYAGFFTTERAGIDTLVFIGEEVLRNPPQKDIDSLLREYKKRILIRSDSYRSPMIPPTSFR